MSSSSSTRSWRRCSAGSPRSSASAWSITAWSSTASRSTAIAEPASVAMLALGVRIAGLVLLVPLLAPLHYPVEACSAARPGRSRFLAIAGAAAGVRPRIEGTPLEPHTLRHRQPCQLARHPRARRRRPGRLRLAGRCRAHGRWSAGSPTSTTRSTSPAPSAAASQRPGRCSSPRRSPAAAAGALPGRDDRARRRVLPFRPSLFASLFPPPPACRSSRSRSIMATRRRNRLVGDEPGMANAQRVLARRGTIAVTLRFLEPSTARPATARPSPPGARQAIAAALASVRAADRL